MALEDARTAFGGRIEGAFAPDFEPVARTFAENFATYGELGASACIELGDVRVLDLWGGHAVRDGPAWERDTIHVVFSCTKAARALVQTPSRWGQFWEKVEQYGVGSYA